MTGVVTAVKTLAIMQPYLFPYIGYFQLVKLADEYVIYDDAQFIKGGWINRNNILINGERRRFSIRLSGASPNKLINEVEIGDDFTRFIKTLGMAYSKAPYVSDVMALLQQIIAYEDKNLARFSANSLRKIAEHLELDTAFAFSSNLEMANAVKGQEKVIAMCKALSADRYVNAIGGRELYSPGDFASEGIELEFLRSTPSSYRQYRGDFIPSLSIIDVLMFNHRERVCEMLDEYELI